LRRHRLHLDSDLARSFPQQPEIAPKDRYLREKLARRRTEDLPRTSANLAGAPLDERERHPAFGTPPPWHAMTATRCCWRAAADLDHAATA
jgi:hypothetical protein